MKKVIFLGSLLLFFACKENKSSTSQEREVVNEEKEISQETDFAGFGEEIEASNAISASAMKEKFQQMQVGDTLQVKFKAEVDKVCKKKGCWMTLKLDDSLRSFVRFKDYGFFVPLNSENRETIVEGKAFVTETSVEELRHYAQDAGKSEKEIAAITEPEKEYAFMATGVLMEEAKAK